jgi:isovaleryl-CoA dehydrogenase
MEYPSLNFAHGETIDMLRSERACLCRRRDRATCRSHRSRQPVSRRPVDQAGRAWVCSASPPRRSTAASASGYLAHIVAMEEISRASASVALSYGAHSNLCVNQIVATARAAQKASLPAEADFRRARRRTRHVGSQRRLGRGRHEAARRAPGDRFVLNGGKMWITNGGDADTLVVYAKTDIDAGPRGITAFIVEKGMPGFSCGAKLDKLGMRGSNTYPLFFDDCEVPEENVLGQLERRRARADERPRLRTRRARRRSAGNHGGGDGSGAALRA